MTMGLSGGRKLTEAEKKQAIFLITEMKSRGIAIPDNLEMPGVNSGGSWNLDQNGYFVRNDGWTFKPRPVLEIFYQFSG